MPNTSKKYFLLLIDIKDSTVLPVSKVDGKMKAVRKLIEKLNKTFAEDLALPLTINYGDEISGLFFTPRNIYRIVTAIRNEFYSLTTIRFAVADGKIAVNSADIRQVGGEVFKKASDAISNLKAQKAYCAWQVKNELLAQCLKSLAEISNRLIVDMSDYQRQVYLLLAEGLNQTEIGQRLNKYTQSVWNAVQKGRAEYILDAEKSINLILAEMK